MFQLLKGMIGVPSDDVLFDTTTLNDEIAQNIVNPIGEIFLVLIPILVVILILIIAQWKLFKKAGEPGWLSLIPICNTVMMFKIAGMSGWWTIGVLLAGFIPVVGTIFSIVINVLLAYNLAKAFDKGAGFTVGLVLLAPIFISILAFGKSQYNLK